MVRFLVNVLAKTDLVDKRYQRTNWQREGTELICTANPSRFQELEAAGTFEGKV